MIHACEQSRRMTIPVLHEAVSLKNFLNNFDENKKLFVGLEKKTTTAGLVNFGKNCTFLVGPEGGFSEKEVKLFSEYEFISEFYFRRNILRSETACIAFIACCVSNCA